MIVDDNLPTGEFPQRDTEVKHQERREKKHNFYRIVYLPIDYYVFTIEGKHCRKPRSGWKNAENPALALSSCHHVIESVIIFNSIKLEMLGRVAEYLRLDCILCVRSTTRTKTQSTRKKTLSRTAETTGYIYIYRTDLMDSGWLLFFFQNHIKGNKRQV